MSIPSTIRVPFVYVDFDPSRAVSGPSILKYKTLIIGQKTSSGTKAELNVDKVRKADEASQFYGAGSQLSRMFSKWFENNDTVDVYGVSISDLVEGVLATGTITLTDNATADGILNFFINGISVKTGVTSGDTPTEMGDALVVSINANTALPVTAANALGVVTLTAKNKGFSGNDTDIQINYFDQEETPSGVTVAIVAMASGAGNPDIQDVLDILGDEWYNIIVNPFTDAANLTALENDLADKFGPIRQIDGVAYISKRGTVGELAIFGDSRNSPHIVCHHSEKIPQSPEEFAASVAGQEASSAENDPAQPFQTLPLIGINAPKVIDRFTWQDNNSLLFDGIATFQVDNASVVRVQRSITMYKTNATGAVDTAYLDANTMFTLSYLRYDFRNTIMRKYPRAKLGNDGGRYPSGQQIMTPKIGKSEAVNMFIKWQEDLGLVENIEQFKNELIVERDPQDPNRLNFLLTPNLINQLRVVGAVIQFIL